MTSSFFVLIFLSSIDEIVTIHCSGLKKVWLGKSIGLGFDALTFNSKNDVLNMKYKHFDVCIRDSPVTFKVPSNVNATPWTNYATSSPNVMFSSFDKKFFAKRGKSLDDEFPFPHEVQIARGIFSRDVQTVRNKLFRTSSVLLTSFERRVLFRLKTNRDVQLNQTFRKMVLKVMRALGKKRRVTAAQVARKIVDVFGTHVIKTEDVGGLFMHETQLKLTFYEKNVALALDVAANKFRDVFYDDNKIKYDKLYEENVVDESVYVEGGFYSQSEGRRIWIQSLDRNLATVGRKGVLLFVLVKKKYFGKSIYAKYLRETRKILQLAILEYFLMNTHKGCVDVKSSNVNLLANVDDKSCSDVINEDLSFLGVEETCEQTESFHTETNHCEKRIFQLSECDVRSKIAEKLYTVKETKCDKKRKKCKENNLNVKWTANACFRSNQLGFGDVFGGLFSAQTENVITKSFSCPSSFMERHLNGLEGGFLSICVKKGDSSNKNGFHLGGFYFTQTKTSFDVNDWENKCRVGFTNYLAAIFDGLLIHYCVRTNNSDVGSVVVRPWIGKILWKNYDEDENYPNDAQTIRFTNNFLIVLCWCMFYLNVK